MRLPTPASGQRGRKFATLPPGSATPTTMSTATRPILRRVRTFCVIAPGLTPMQLSAVSATIDATATSFTSQGPSGTKKPR